MADQATLKGANGPMSDTRSGRLTSGGPGDQSPGAVMSNVAGFGENLLTLTELQARLATIEIRQNVESAKTPGTFLVGASVLAVVGLPVFLVGIAELLVSELAFKRGYALLMIAGCAIAIATLLAGVGLASLRNTRFGFPLTSEELSRNVQWIRTVLQHSGRPASRR
jgi:Putative Actinobacterial Holin-X, holin superfamily III